MADKSYLNIAIDLGTESVKVVGAYKAKNGEVRRCFLSDPAGVEGQPFSSLALYLGPPQYKWIFGQDINKRDDYANLVRVKEMLYLLASKDEKDHHYYNQEKKFPIFIFPPKPGQPNVKNGMSQLDEGRYTFEGAITPKQMVREFFKALFERCIKNQAERILKENPHLAGIKYISIFPNPKMREEYKNELVELIAYGADIDKGSPMITSMSTPQAIAIGAYVEGLIKATDYTRDDDKTLIFDIGERNISIAKVDVKTKSSSSDGEISICVDGVDGGGQECTIGCTDIDIAIGELAKSRASSKGYIKKSKYDISYDYMSYRQQYRLLKHVKSAKKHLLHYDYAYVTVEKDVNIDEVITKDDFDNIIFGNENTVGAKIAEYIISQLQKQGNENVKTVLLVGGGAASYHLRDYVEARCQEENILGVRIITTDNTRDETSEYFSAIGGAMLDPSGLLLKVVSAYTYGTRRTQYLTNSPNDKGERVFHIWINRGDEISIDEPSFEFQTSLSFFDAVYRYPYRLNPEKYYLDADLKNNNIEYFIYKEPLYLGMDDNSVEFKEAVKNGLIILDQKRTKDDQIKFAIQVDEKRIAINDILNKDLLQKGKFKDRGVYFKQGARISENGDVTPFYENNVERNVERNSDLYVTYNGKTYYAKDFVIDGKLDPFKVETTN